MIKKLQHDEALICLEKAIKISPKKPNALFYKGIILGKTGKHELALNCFENVCRINPQHLDALFQKGNQLAALDMHKKAVSVFDKVLEKFGGNVSVIYAKSRSLAALNEIEESFKLLKNAVKQSRQIKDWAKEDEIFEYIFGKPMQE